MSTMFQNSFVGRVEVRRTCRQGLLHVLGLSLRELWSLTNMTCVPALDMVNLWLDYNRRNMLRLRDLLVLQIREPSLMPGHGLVGEFGITSWLVLIVRLVCLRIHTKEECLLLLVPFHTEGKFIDGLFHMGRVLILDPLPILTYSLQVSSLLLEWFTCGSACINCLGGFSVGSDRSGK